MLLSCTQLIAASKARNAGVCRFINMANFFYHVGKKTHHIGIASLWSRVDTDISGQPSLHIGLHWNMYWHHTPLRIPHIIHHKSADVQYVTDNFSCLIMVLNVKLICTTAIRDILKMRLLTMQTADLFTHPSPTRAALIDCVQLHTVHLPVHCVVCCPEEETF